MRIAEVSPTVLHLKHRLVQLIEKAGEEKWTRPEARMSDGS
jgi:hypothetical protein